VFTYVRSIAGFGGSNEFWIYQSTNDVATARVELIFDGNPGVGAMVTGLFSQSAQANDFGLMLQVFQANGDIHDLDYTLYSDDSRNPGQLPQALVFIGNGQKFASPLGNDGYFNDVDIIIAFEDLNRASGVSDDDFNDIIVLIENVLMGQPAPEPDFEIRLPEPASLVVWSVLAGIGGLASWRRWRKNRAK
jgi:hypothetical protein